MKLRKPFDFSFDGLVRQCHSRPGQSQVTVANNCTAELVIRSASAPTRPTPGVSPYGIVFRLHGNVIAVLSDRQVTLYDGGHRTNTTKDRLQDILTDNRALLGDRFHAVFQRNWQWYLRIGHYSDPTGSVVPFTSGMTLRPVTAPTLAASTTPAPAPGPTSSLFNPRRLAAPSGR